MAASWCSQNDPAASDAEVFVDLRNRVHREGEAGLLGFAFHPDFATNGRVYLNYSELIGAQLRSVTSEFTSPDGGQTLDPGFGARPADRREVRHEPQRRQSRLRTG